MEPVAAAPATRAKTELKKVENVAGVDPAAKKSYVPQPPADGPKIPPPAGMPAVKTFPISTGPPPAGMSFPGAAGVAPEEKKEGAQGQEGQDAAPAEEIDDGISPE